MNFVFLFFYFKSIHYIFTKFGKFAPQNSNHLITCFKQHFAHVLPVEEFVSSALASIGTSQTETEKLYQLFRRLLKSCCFSKCKNINLVIITGKLSVKNIFCVDLVLCVFWFWILIQLNCSFVLIVLICIKNVVDPTSGANHRRVFLQPGLQHH